VTHRYPIFRSFRLTVPGWKVTKKRLSKALHPLVTSFDDVLIRATAQASWA